MARTKALGARWPQRGWRSLALVTACAAMAGTALPAAAEVRFGRNVRIGGHDVSNQTFNSKRRGVFYLYDRTPPNAGCRWRGDGRGGRVKTCHLRQLGSRR